MTATTVRKFRNIAATAGALLATGMLAACGTGTGQSASAAEQIETPESAGETVVSVDDADTAEQARAALLETGKLTVGVEGTYPPFNFHDTASGKLTGYDVDVITAVAEKIGVSPEFSEVKWDGLLAGLEAGHYDVVANQVAVTPERQEIYEFSSPYSISTAVVVTRSDDTSITGIADVDGRSAAQSVTSNWAELARGAGAEVVPVDGFAEAIAAIRDTRVDLTFNDELAVLDYFNATGDDGVHIAFDVPEETTEQAIVVREGSVGLAELLTETLEELRSDGTLAQIGTEYFGRDISQ